MYDPDGISSGYMNYNLIRNAKGSECPRGANDLCADPLLVSDSLGSLDGHLQPASPAVDSGLGVAGLIPNHDLENRVRPWGAQVDRGAFEYGSIQPVKPGKPLTGLYPLLWD